MKKKSLGVAKVQKRKKAIAVDRMGGKCCLCGYKKCLSALEFHHLNKDEKEEKPSHVVLNWKWERAKEELDKCILVCSNCHREIHHEMNGTELCQLNVHRKKWIDKKCPQCKKDFETKVYEQVFCCRSCSDFYNRKVVRPSKRDLSRLIKSRVTWTQMGKMFGVSDNAVRKWAKSYKLPTSKKDIDNLM